MRIRNTAFYSAVFFVRLPDSEAATALREAIRSGASNLKVTYFRVSDPQSLKVNPDPAYKMNAGPNPIFFSLSINVDPILGYYMFQNF